MRYPAETAYFSCDALGNRTWMANAQRQVYFTYDALGRTEHVHASDSASGRNRGTQGLDGRMVCDGG